MVLSRQTAAAVRAALGALFLAALLLQFWIVPGLAAESAARYPYLAGLAAPYVIAIGVGLGLFEVALLAAWRVLAAASEGATKRQQRWADVMTFALVLMAVVFAGVCVHAGSVARVGGPPMLFGLIASIVVAACAGLARRRVSGLTVADGPWG